MTQAVPTDHRDAVRLQLLGNGLVEVAPAAVTGKDDCQQTSAWRGRQFDQGKICDTARGRVGDWREVGSQQSRQRRCGAKSGDVDKVDRRPGPLLRRYTLAGRHCAVTRKPDHPEARQCRPGPVSKPTIRLRRCRWR
jgi:hypothetical protein